MEVCGLDDTPPPAFRMDWIGRVTAYTPIPASNVEQTLVVIRRLHSISPAQASVVAQAVAALPTPWRVECHDDYEGYLWIVVSRDGHDAPTFAVSGKLHQVELCEIRDDELNARGGFSTVVDATHALVGLLQAECP